VAWTSSAVGGARSGGRLLQDPVVATIDAGVATLSGVLLSDDDSRVPVRRATVRVTGERLGNPRMVGTDDSGRFVFHDLPAGSVTLSATKPGYVPTYYGSTRPGIGPGVPVALTPEETIDVVLRLLRGGVITGSVIDAFGRAAPSVSVLAVGLGQGPAALATVEGAATDDRGEYRIFGLAPGDYLVVAQPNLQPPGPTSWRAPTEVLSTPSTAGQAVRAAGTGTGVSESSSAPAERQEGASAVTYAPVYYPGTTNLAAAVPVSVEPGREISGVGVALEIVPVARIAGRLVDENGRPASPATVSVYPRWKQELALVDRLAALGALNLPRATVADSSFSVAGVAPGDYTLVARSGSATIRSTTNAPSDAERLWGLLDVTVTGTDQRDLVIRLAPGISLTGRVIFEGSSPSEQDEWRSIGLSLEGVGTHLGQASTATAVIEPDGTFRFDSVVPGQYTLRARIPTAVRNQGWSLKSALLDGHDFADLPLGIEPGTVARQGLEITFTDRAAEISGHLFDATGRPESRYSIVVVTTDRALWLPNGRRIRSVRPATDGSFRVRGLPAGDYVIAAIRDIESVDLADPTFLARLVEAGYSLTLLPGATVEQDLRVAGGGSR
jgi:hypothetical protein